MVLQSLVLVAGKVRATALLVSNLTRPLQPRTTGSLLPRPLQPRTKVPLQPLQPKVETQKSVVKTVRSAVLSL